MFTDGRSKKVIFLAHCLLNQNAISDGTAVTPAAFGGLIRLLLEAEVGMVQMPCPELCCLGLDRGNVLGAQAPVVRENTRIRGEMNRPAHLERWTGLAEYVTDQIAEYRRHGFAVLGIVGANRSPTCGVDTTSRDDREQPGRGVFLEEIARRLGEAGLEIPLVGVKTPEEAEEKVRALLFPDAQA